MALADRTLGACSLHRASRIVWKFGEFCSYDGGVESLLQRLQDGELRPTSCGLTWSILALFARMLHVQVAVRLKLAPACGSCLPPLPSQPQTPYRLREDSDRPCPQQLPDGHLAESWSGNIIIDWLIVIP